MLVLGYYFQLKILFVIYKDRNILGPVALLSQLFPAVIISLIWTYSVGAALQIGKIGDSPEDTFSVFGPHFFRMT